jgi:hypothetical protein
VQAALEQDRDQRGDADPLDSPDRELSEPRHEVGGERREQQEDRGRGDGEPLGQLDRHQRERDRDRGDEDDDGDEDDEDYERIEKTAAELAEEGIQAKVSPIERWLEDEERWTGDPPQETWEEEELERGYAPWEVRVEYRSHADARRAGDELEREGYDVVRRFRYLVIGTASEEDARKLAERLHGQVEPGGELVWEVVPQNPFAIFGGLGGSGTPL